MYKVKVTYINGDVVNTIAPSDISVDDIMCVLSHIKSMPIVSFNFDLMKGDEICETENEEV